LFDRNSAARKKFVQIFFLLRPKLSPDRLIMFKKASDVVFGMSGEKRDAA
jgi:hypothetical protein